MRAGVERNLGPTATRGQQGVAGGEVQLLPTTYRYQTTEQQILAVKASVHFRAAFTPIAARIVEVDTPGLTSPHLERFEFRRIPRPMYPLDREMAWAPPAE